MPDYICPNCGQKALQVATRCPHCRLPIEAQFIQYQVAAPKPGRLRLIVIVVAVLVILFVAGRLLPPARPSATGRRQAVVIDSTTTHPVAAITESLPTVTDSAVPPPVPAVAAESLTATVDSAPVPLPPPVAAPAALPHGAVRRFAGTWINVRSGRNNRAPVIRILHPGDTVVVDSLMRGWYRVIARGEAVGYLDRRLLDTVPSATRP